MAWLSEIAAAVRVKMSPRLLRWFSSYAPKKPDKRKLGFREAEDGSYEYEETELLAFDQYLRSKWSPPTTGGRPPTPTGIHEEVKIEAASGCAFCQYMNDCEAAHIDAVASSLNNHPHNLLYACPNHHTQYDNGHKIHGTVDRATVTAVKKDLLEARLRLWRAEARVENKLLLLAAEVDELRERLKKTPEESLRLAVERQANEALVLLREAAQQPEVKRASAAKKELGERVSAATGDSLTKALDEVSDARGKYLEEASEVECPLCKGSGGTFLYDFCPICTGSGSLDRDRAELLDLTEFEAVPCPLCEGKGHGKGYERCPACGGHGELTKSDADEIDLGEYAFVACPLCEGKGHGKGYEQCPACGGEGELPQHVANEVDVSEYAFVECPLCEGKGHGKGYDNCPACGGEGQLPQEAANEVDVSEYAFVACPVCNGRGHTKKDDRCPGCGGEGSLPKRDADELDPTDY